MDDVKIVPYISFELGRCDKIFVQSLLLFWLGHKNEFCHVLVIIGQVLVTVFFCGNIQEFSQQF